jgi:iron complex transport system substrate-binding protein
MRSKKYLIPILICVLGCMMLVSGCGKNDSKKEPESKTLTITDSTGRSVELPQPLEKVVILVSYTAEAMRIMKVQDKVIIGVSDSLKNHEYLGMQDKDSVGKASQPSYEKIVALRPQVVFFYSGTSGEELVEKLEPAGIKVVLLDLYKPETYDNDLKTLAKIFEKEKEADAFLKWKAKQIAILDKVKDLKPEQRVTAFIIAIKRFENNQWYTSGGGSTHQAIEMAGGINVAHKIGGSSQEVSPEWILQQNPEVLVFRDYSPNDYLGYTINDFANSEKLKEKAMNNNILSKTDAVKNDHIYNLANDIFGSDKSYLGAFYLAKWFYPDLFKDLDPEKALKEYFEKWMDIPFQGKWAYPPPK